MDKSVNKGADLTGHVFARLRVVREIERIRVRYGRGSPEFRRAAMRGVL